MGTVHARSRNVHQVHRLRLVAEEPLDSGKTCVLRYSPCTFSLAPLDPLPLPGRGLQQCCSTTFSDCASERLRGAASAWRQALSSCTVHSPKNSVLDPFL